MSDLIGAVRRVNIKKGLIGVGIIVGLVLNWVLGALSHSFGSYTTHVYIMTVLLIAGIGLYVIGSTALLVGLAATKQRKWGWEIAGLALISIMLLAAGWYAWWLFRNSP